MYYTFSNWITYISVNAKIIVYSTEQKWTTGKNVIVSTSNFSHFHECLLLVPCVPLQVFTLRKGGYFTWTQRKHTMEACSIWGKDVLFVGLLYPSLQRSWKGGILVSPCPSVDRSVSALYLQQYLSDPFHICTSYQATLEGVSHVMFVSKFQNLKFWQIL